MELSPTTLQTITLIVIALGSAVGGWLVFELRDLRKSAQRNNEQLWSAINNLRTGQVDIKESTHQDMVLHERENNTWRENVISRLSRVETLLVRNGREDAKH